MGRGSEREPREKDKSKYGNHFVIVDVAGMRLAVVRPVTALLVVDLAGLPHGVGARKIEFGPCSNCPWGWAQAAAS